MRTLSLAAVGLLSVALGAQEPWRSTLYPEDWEPGTTDAQGRFLHDVSYSGYRGGEEPPLRMERPRLDVVGDFRADRTGEEDAHGAIQAAIDAVGAQGGVVLLPAGLYRCDGPLVVRNPGTVLRGEGPTATRLFFTSVPDRGWRNHLQVRGERQWGKDIPLAADAENRATSLLVTDPSGLAVGDDVAVGWTITLEFVAEHGMTGTWKAFNGTWRPFFLRTVTRLDREPQGCRVTVDVPLRYAAKRRDSASIRVMTGAIRECGIESLGIANAVEWGAAWRRAGAHAIGFQNAADCWVREVASFASPLPEAKGYHLQSGGILIADSKRVTVAECRLERAQNRGGGGAGYLYHVMRSNEVLTRDCTAVAGRHNFIQNWDFGSSGLVWLRCSSRDGRGYAFLLDPIGYEGLCEYHHSLAMACLVDSCVLDDGWFAGNRHDWSSGAGATVTQSIFWNTTGRGRLRSWQTGHGYVIGTSGVRVETALGSRPAEATEPEDFREGIDRAADLRPQSLYEDQRRRRLRRRPTPGQPP
ncbi:MAG: hypothetical protein JXR77_03585 [Lentisphaeria bacterium]|nr:hypothetical protein [Lentisphaeria bacterium]